MSGVAKERDDRDQRCRPEPDDLRAPAARVVPGSAATSRPSLTESAQAHLRGFVPRSPARRPGLADLGAEDRSAFRADLLPAVTVAAVAVPASLGMAEFAGLSVVVGLCATMLPLVG